MKRSLTTWLCAGLLSGTIAAQTTGTISGTVSDRSGAVLAGAIVELQNAATLEARTATTNSAGKYAFPSVAPGNYDLRFSYTGFTNLVQHLTLHVTDRLAVDAVLQPAGIVHTVEVTAQAVTLQTETPALSRVVDGSDITQLPLSTRNFTQLLALSPGTSAPLNDAGALGRATQNISTNGARTGSNAVYIDGVDAVNLHSNSARIQSANCFV
jgi:Carboxypeptidase regulatory-like domain